MLGCTCFSFKINKLYVHIVCCAFLGYGGGQKGYCCYDPIAKKLYVSHHVIFLENIPFFSIFYTQQVSKSCLIYIIPFLYDPPCTSSIDVSSSQSSCVAIDDVSPPPVVIPNPPAIADPPSPNTLQTYS